MATEPEDTETPETETSSLGDEWQWISNDTAEVLRATVEAAFTADPRKNWSAEEIARWIRDVALHRKPPLETTPGLSPTLRTLELSPGTTPGHRQRDDPSGKNPKSQSMTLELFWG